MRRERVNLDDFEDFDDLDLDLDLDLDFDFDDIVSVTDDLDNEEITSSSLSSTMLLSFLIWRYSLHF